MPQRKLSDHLNGVSIEIMAQFARSDQDSIEQLLDLGVTGLRLVEYLADEVYWSLDLVHMPNLLALDNDGNTNYPIGGRNVKQQSLAFLGRCQDRRRCEKLLELCKSSVSFLRPLKLLLCLEKFDERQTLFVGP
jgi:hypothetical protein